MAVGNGRGVEIASMGYEAAFGNRPVRQSGPAPGFGMMVEHEHTVPPPRAGEDAVTVYDDGMQCRRMREAVTEILPFEPLLAPASEAFADDDV